MSRSRWFHRLEILWVVVGCLLWVAASAEEDGSKNGEVEPGGGPPAAQTTEPPAGMIRIGPSQVVSPTRIESNPGASPFVFVKREAITSTMALGNFPPDPHGACGPKGYLSTSGISFQYFDRSGNGIWFRNYNFFPDIVDQPADAKACYDAAAGRFYIVIHDRTASQSYCHVAVSKNSNPLTSTTSDWYFYRFEITEVAGGVSYGGDYTTLGFDSSAVYVEFSMLSLPLVKNSTFKNGLILVFNKAKITSGDASAPTQVFTPDGIGFHLQPATVTGLGGPGDVAYFSEIDLSSTTNVRLWALNHPLSQDVRVVDRAEPRWPGRRRPATGD